MDVDTRLYLRRRTNKVILSSTGTLVSISWQPGREGSLGSRDMCVRTAESLHCPPEAINVLLTGYTPIQNKKFKQICLPSRLTSIVNFLSCKHDSKCHMLKFPQPPSEAGVGIIPPYTQGRGMERLRNSSKAAQQASREACVRIQEAWPERGRGRNVAQAPAFTQNCLCFGMMGLKKKKSYHL